MADHYLTGIIEGFYGRPWPWRRRAQLIDDLAGWGLDLYVYAPKGDRQLRRDWRSPWPRDHLQQLLTLREQARTCGVAFGIGFSPWGLQAQYSAADAQALRGKMRELEALAPDWLGILFDDMPGEGGDLAQRQAAIVSDIVAVSSARRFAMCPSWYSDDPQLTALFGPLPAGYLATLGRELPASVDICWTGPQVVSPGYRREDFAAVTAQLGRRPLLWDNYPVNDGRRISRFLHLRPLLHRPRELRDWCSGHLLNPMNQPLLSRPALASLGAIHGEEVDTSAALLAWWQRELPALVGPATAALLQRDVDRFQDAGLDALDSGEKAALIAEYRATGEDAAAEVVEWLEEGYRFDPDCLND